MRFRQVRPADQFRSADQAPHSDRLDEKLAVIEEAGRVTLRALEHDQEHAPEKLHALFESMRHHLFDQDLDLKQIQEDAGVSNGSAIWKTFREVIGESPWNYLLKARLEIGARLLLHTSLQAPRIAELVGYSTAASFRKAFTPFAGASPTRYRNRARRVLKRGGAPPRGADQQGYWEKALAGELSSEEVRELDDHLAGLYPASGSEPGAVINDAPSAQSEAHTWIKMRAEMAFALTDALGELDWADQRLLVRDATWFPDASLFNALSQRNREVRAKNPPRAVQLALLAVDSLASNGLLGIDPSVAVLGWTRMACCRWLAGDLPGAEDALTQVARDLERQPEKDREPMVEAERYRLMSALRWFQGHADEALNLADAAVRQARQARFGFLAWALLLRAEIRACVDLQVAPSRRRASLLAALEDLREVRELREAGGNWQTRLVLELWLYVLVRLGDRREMELALPEARRLVEKMEADGEDRASGDGEALARLRWFEGHVSEESESLWRQAHEDFVRLGDEVWVARTTLTLLRHGSEARTAELAAELGKTLGTMAQSSDSLKVVDALRRVAASGADASEQLTSGVLDAAEIVLGRLDVDLRARRASRFVKG